MLPYPRVSSDRWWRARPAAAAQRARPGLL